MDSKYNLIENGTNGSHHVNGFTIKRKFSNGSSSTANGNLKKIKPNSSKKLFSGQGGRLSGGSSCASHIIKPQLSIADQRKNLPVYQVRSSLVKKILHNQTIIIIGETGSGKTTQIPQYLLEAGLADNGMIAVTQPRRVAAITISKRVSQEHQCRLGDTVGYTVRFEDVTSKSTKIRFMTDGSLLREALSDRLLKQYKVIILDEAHERTINTDVLFGIVKEAQKVRAENHGLPSLKIIIMSATMDVDHFSEYFNNCEPIYLAGRTYPIKVFHTKETQNDYQHACLSTIFEIHKTAPANHYILVFLTGQEEIEALTQEIRQIAKSNEIEGPTIRVFPLYSQLPQHKQLEVFQPLQSGSRKIILCTNIAETSLTIKGIKYVIDSGMVKRKVFDSVLEMDLLKTVRIAQDQAWQRTGRAGRESTGFCYRTYTLADYKSMPTTCIPEILRSNITATVLQLMALGINCKKFDFIDKPSDNDIDLALNQLHKLGAIKSIESDELTAVGQKMAKFPLDPRYSKMLLLAPEYDCLNEMLSIVAILSSESIFVNCFDEERRANAIIAHNRFESIYGDHLTQLNVFNAFQKTEKVKTWCHENFMNIRNLTYAQEVRKQLSDICDLLELSNSSCETNVDQVRKCLIAGLFKNVAELQITDNQYITLSTRQKVKIHPSSVLINKPKSQCVLFTELVSTTQNYMRCVTSIEPEWIEEIVPNCEYIKRFSHYS